MTEPLLDVRDLRVTFLTDGGDVTAVDGVSLALGADEVLGIVGESGSGKSVTMMSVMRLVPERNTRFEGEVLFGGATSCSSRERTMREVRGSEIAMIFQDPMTSLNPVYTVGWQIAEQAARARALSAATARDRGDRAARSVGIPRRRAARRRLPAPVLRRHAAARDDRDGARRAARELLIADEPTTALDVTIQAQILDLIRTLRRETRLGGGADHARPRRRRRDRRPRAGHVRRADRRAGPDARDLPRPAAPVHVGAARLDRAARPPAAAPPDRDPAAAPRRRWATPPGCPFAPRCPIARALLGAAAAGRQARRRITSTPAGCRVEQAPSASCGERARELRADRDVRPPLRRCVEHFPVFVRAATVATVHAVDGVSSRSARARRSASSASRAAARRRSAARCCGSRR